MGIVSWFKQKTKEKDEEKIKPINFNRRKNISIKKGLCKSCGHNKIWFNKGKYKCTKCGSEIKDGQ